MLCEGIATWIDLYHDTASVLFPEDVYRCI
jgi:hypothetical protein